jgi:hypothetical protein
LTLPEGLVQLATPTPTLRPLSGVPPDVSNTFRQQCEAQGGVVRQGTGGVGGLQCLRR